MRVSLALTLVLAAGGHAEPVQESLATRLDVHGDPLPEGARQRFGSTRLRHAGAVVFLAYSPGGDWLASGGSDGSVRVSSASDGSVRLAARIPDELATRAAFSPDGARLAVLSTSGELRISDLASGAVTEETSVRGAQLADVAWCRDASRGSRLLVAGGDAQGGSWELLAENGDETLRRGETRFAVRCVAFAQDGARFALAAVNGRKLLRRAGSAEQELSELSVLDAESGTTVFARAFAESVITSTFFLDGGRVVAVLEDEGARIFDLASGAESRIAATGTLSGAALAGERCVLLRAPLSPGAVGAIELWSVPAGGTPERLSQQPASGAFVVAAAGERVAVDQGLGIRQWSVPDWVSAPRLDGHTAPVRALATAEQGALLVSAGNDGTVRIWDSASGRQVEEHSDHEGHAGLVFCVDVAADGARVVSGAQDGTARIVERGSGKVRVLSAGEDHAVTDVAFSPDGSAIATVSAAGALRIWDAATGRLEREITGLRGLELLLAFAPDGETLAVGGSELRLVRWRTGEQRLRIEDLASPLQALAFAPDGRTLAGGFAHRALVLWDVESGVVAHTLEGAHQGRVAALAWSGDGTRLASAGQSETRIRVFDTATWTEIATHAGHAAPVSALCYSGATLFSGGQDGLIYAW